jgi:hypothetical protein
MLSKDGRQAKSILAAVRDLTTALQERSISAPQISNHEDHTPIVLSLLGSVKDGLDALLYASKTQVEETKTFQRQALRIQWLVFFVSAAAFIAAGIYANVGRLQKKTMDATLGQIQKQLAAAEVANNLARRTLQNEIDAERPWVGIAFRIQDWTIGRNASATAIVTNSGRRPAKLTRVQFDSNEYVVFPDNPRYRRSSRDIRGSALILPNGSVANTQRLRVVTQPELDDLGLRRHTFFIYASVDYEDVLTRSVHWTHGCWQYLPGLHNTANRFVKCSTYNDVDEEKSPNE